jgi:hypothetical protein
MAGPDGIVGYEDLSDTTLIALRTSALNEGAKGAAEAIQQELDRRENPDLFRHSRRR